jgi:hypothetical protein
MRPLVHVLIAMVVIGSAAPAAADLWQSVDETSIGSRRTLEPIAHVTLRLDRVELQSVLSRAPMEFTQGHGGGIELPLPMPDGAMARFRIEESPIMEPELAARYPEIHTYRGQGIDDPTATTRFGWTSAGFHAIVLSAKGTAFIDPYATNDTEHYIAYFDRDQSVAGREPFSCGVPGSETPAIQLDPGAMNEVLEHRSGKLLTYRLAQAADYEYVLFHSSPSPASKALAMSRGIIPTINRVDGIYERDLAIHMNLVANNDAIVFDTSADPYNNSDGGQMLGQNQTTCDGLIGSANYDIGHVFSTGGGGVAYLGVVCNSNFKAGGVTGNGAPIGDGFDVDYVAHEMGHQFGGNHSFNGNAGACSGGNRNASTAYEVGSGSTVMAYAGICGAQDLQPHSDDNFHGINLQEMIQFTDAGFGNVCDVSTPVPNQSPFVDAGPTYTIPARTPFTLTAAGGDPDADAVTYNWEEFDLGPAGSGTTDNGSSPIFRAFPSSTSPARTFPRMANILGGSSTYGEVLPTTTRTMTFRCTIRDNYAGAGAVDWDQTQVSVVAGAGPFAVTAPNGGEVWEALRPATVTWDVAGTAGAPVSTATVDILVSGDGGQTFQPLAPGVPIDGEEAVLAPSIESSQARIMVRGGGNIFFDVSNANFSIVGRPIANADSTVTPVNTPVLIDVLANDLDPNGQPLAIVHVDSPTVRGGTAAIDDNGTPGNPGDDRILYTPAAGSPRRDSFGYVISDGAYLDTTTVAVKVILTADAGDPAGLRGLALGIRPNPSAGPTTIEYVLPLPGRARIDVFDVSGRRVTQLLEPDRPAGAYLVRWDGRDATGHRVAQGSYVLRAELSGHIVTRTITVIR